jgi:hypothetical protein
MTDRHVAIRWRRRVVGGLIVAALLGAAACTDDLTADPAAPAERLGGPIVFAALPLMNGWANAPFSTRAAGVFFDPNSGITHFSGAISGGTSAVVFTLSQLYRPNVDVYISVDLCNATKGRLHIAPTGVVSVQAEGAFANAQCFTSLEGASYASGSAGFDALTLQNSWATVPANSFALWGNLGGAIRFGGAVAGGTTGQLFTLPANAAPSTNVYVPIDLCNATNGRLLIQPSGAVSVQAEGAFTNAQCFTSLAGAWFVRDAAGLTPLTLQNGWTNAPFATSAAAVKNVGGIVHFRGAIAGGTTAQVFTLPPGFAPTTNVYVAVDLCGAKNGRLLIQPSGVVSVQAELAFSDAQCFTSLDGASYSIAGFVP